MKSTKNKAKAQALENSLIHHILQEKLLNIIENLPPELESIREQLDSLVRRHRLLPALFIVLEEAQPNVPGVLLVQ